MSTLFAHQPEPAEIVPFPAPAEKRRKLHPWAWLLLLWGLSGVYIVPADQQAVVTRFGAVAEPRVVSGIHYALPWPIDSVYKLKVRQLRRTVVGGEAADAVLGRTQPASSQFLSGDQNLLNVRVVAQYSVSEPAKFLFQTENVDRLIALAVESELARRLARSPVDDILTTEKTAIQNEVLLTTQRTLDDYYAGVTITSINIESVTPPAEAADAFRSVAGARADAIRLVNEAEGYANDLLPRARGEAAQLEQEAQAYRDGKINRAAGDAARFDQVAAEYAKAPRVTATRAYVEAMEQILPKMKKLVLDSNGNLDVTMVGRDNTAPASQNGGSAK